MFAAGTNAFLRCRGPRIVALLNAEKYVLKLIHPRVRKKQGRVICRQQRRRMYDLVTVAFEILKKFGPYLVSRHTKTLAHRPFTSHFLANEFS